ncbi:MAG: mechanosensitive ion channel family protein [Spirulinaceae cyanobacterium]
MNNPYYLLTLNLAQAGSETAEKAKELIGDITRGKITQALAILLIAYISNWLLDKLINWISERVPLQLRPEVRQSLPFWQFLVVIVTTGTISNIFLDLSPSNILALSGTVAVALGFAFKDYISSVIAGAVVLFETTYRVGDRITIGEQYGEVVTYGLRSFRLQTLTDDTVTIPHNKIWTEAIINANDGDVEAQVVTDFYLSHDVNTQLVIEILTEAAYTSKYTQLQLPVVVSLEEKPWGSHFQLKAYPMDVRAETAYKTDLSKRCKQAFVEKGISYPPYGNGKIGG